MPTQNNKSIKWIFSILLLAVASLGFAWVYYQNESVTEVPGKKEIKSSQGNIDEMSKKIMMDMSSYLTGLKEFSFQSNGYFEVIDSL